MTPEQRSEGKRGVLSSKPEKLLTMTEGTGTEDSEKNTQRETLDLKASHARQGMVVHTFNPSTGEAEAGDPCDPQRVPRQPELHTETLP